MTRTRLLLLISLSTLVSLPSCRSSQSAPTRSREPGAVNVTAATAVRQPSPIEIRTFGSVEARESVTVRPQVSEVLRAVHFAKGQTVHRGDLLFEIDARPFEIALRQAQAQLARTQAQSADAARELARQADLMKKGFATENEHAKVKAAADALVAAVEADKAAVDKARLELDYCKIVSPITGRAGDALVTAGNLVLANQTALVQINQLSPIDVYFSVPQDQKAEVLRWCGSIDGRCTTSPAGLSVTVWPPGPDAPETGELTFVEPTVERVTGTFRLGATFANPSERLWPGQHVRVALRLALQADALVVPAVAVQTGRDGQYVWVIKSDGAVEIRPVTVARTANQLAVIADGLDVNERVVTDGHVHLTPRSKVQITDPAGRPAPASQPQRDPAQPGRRGGQP